LRNADNCIRKAVNREDAVRDAGGDMATIFCNALVWLIGVCSFLTAFDSFAFQQVPKSGESERLPKLEIPALRDRVMDLVGILKDAESDNLKARLASLEKDTTTQMAVLLIPGLQGEVLEDYSLRVANRWKLGRKDLNNGVILLIALQNRALRIEVGLGLESILTKEACKKIIDEEIVPFFKKGEFYKGIDSGISALTRLLKSVPASIVGRWRSLATTQGGIGAMLEFHSDGVVDWSPGAVVEMDYRIEGDKLVLPPATKTGPEQSRALEWLGEDRVLLKDTGDELSRRSARLDPKHPIVGEWTGKYGFSGRQVESRWLFYANGKMLLLIPFGSLHGHYTTNQQTIRMELPGRSSWQGKFEVRGDLLILTGEQGESRLARY
jgi:hypothetical protein